MKNKSTNQPPSFQPTRIFLPTILLLLIPSLLHAADDTLFLRAVNHLLLGSDSCYVHQDANDIKYSSSYYEGLYEYRKDMSHRSYGLKQLSDSSFSRLSLSDKGKVADKLLSSLFFGYPASQLKEKVSSGNFICSIRKGLAERSNNMASVEEEIRDENRYYHSTSSSSQNDVYDILARFYAMKHLDMNYLHNWMAYILTQTIMFSPSYELESSHYPNVPRVYNRLVTGIDEDRGMRYATFLHMTSSDNWRRFRSPEDNGREMLEIYTLDGNDANVPKAAKTLQNWYLDTDYDTLVVGLDRNTVQQSLFNTSVTTGIDFYRELVKSGGFVSGSVRRLVDFFFTDLNDSGKARISKVIVSSKPETWQDVLLQIVFSEEYLLHSSRAKSGEELFYSLVKKLEYKHYYRTFYYLRDNLEKMNQASMKYKLGKLERTPLDSLSFAYYHKYIREVILIRSVCGENEETGYYDWNNYGWRPQLLSNDRFSYYEDNPRHTISAFVNYLFEFMIHRPASTLELAMFTDNMLREDGEYDSSYNFRRIDGIGCYAWRENSAEDVLDYISRLSELYMYQEVK